MVKVLKYVKLALYIMCLSSLFFPVNLNGHGQWIIGMDYIADLFKSGDGAEKVFWFFYYFALFILPVAIEAVVWFFSKRGVMSNIADILVGTACATALFCYFVSFGKKPSGILIVIILQIIIIAIGCLDFIIKIFSQKYFDDIILNKRRVKKITCLYCGKKFKEGKVCSCRRVRS